MHFLQQFFFYLQYSYTKMLFAFRNSESASSKNPQTYCTGNEWPNYDKKNEKKIILESFLD